VKSISAVLGDLENTTTLAKKTAGKIANESGQTHEADEQRGTEVLKGHGFSRRGMFFRQSSVVSRKFAS
jgi:hypothetical protein